jgi:hypothetical protein
MKIMKSAVAKTVNMSLRLAYKQIPIVAAAPCQTGPSLVLSDLLHSSSLQRQNLYYIINCVHLELINI